MNERPPVPVLTTGRLEPTAAGLDPSLADARLREAVARLVPPSDLRMACAELLSILVEATEASRASLMLVNPETGRLRIMAAVALPQEMVGQDLRPARRRISDWVFRERRPLILNGEVRDQRFEGSAGQGAIESAMCVPILGTGGPLGVLNLARGSPAAVFGPHDTAATERLALQVAATLERLMELALAERGRLQLLSLTAASWNGESRAETFGTTRFQMAIAHAASPLVAGDFCERVVHADGAQSLMVADVMGSGPAAVAAGALTRGLFVALCRTNRSPAEQATILNEELHQRLGKGRFVTMWLAHLTPDGRQVSCSAGVPSPLWSPLEGGGPRRLDTGGPPVGAFPRTYYEQEMLRLLPGDVVVAVSDGLLHAQDATGQPFGYERLSELLSEQRRQPLDRMVETISRAALDFTGHPRPPDDVMVFALRYSRDE